MDDAAPLLQDYLEDSAARLPDKVAISCGREQLTYAEIDRRANRLAHALAARGIRRGDRIVIFAENGPVAAVAFWAALKASAVPVLLGPQTRPRRLAYVLSDSGARALVSQAQLAPAFCEAAPAAGALSVAVIAGDLTNEPPLPMLPWDEAIGPANSAARPPRQSVDIDLAALVYTSGSTGEPKGVMLTHRNMLAASASIARYLAYRESDAVLCVLPFAFDYGLYQMLLAFKVGARLVLERSFAFPAAVLDTVSREGVTVFPGVPTLFAMLIELKANERWDLSRIRIVTNTAAALAPRQLRALRD